MPINPSGVTNEELLDLIKATADAAERGKMVVTQEQQNYYVVDALLRPDRVELQTGEKATWLVKLDQGSLGTHVLPYEKMDLNVLDLLSQAEENWCIQRTPMVWNADLLRRNVNTDGNQILNLLDVVRVDAQQSTAKAFEDKFFAEPTTDPRSPHGLLYFVPLFAPGQSGAGFYGGVYSPDFTTVSGISPATSGSNTTSITGGKAHWRCWQGGGPGYYTAWDQTLLDTMDNARMSIQFIAPRIVTLHTRETVWTDWKILTNKDTRIGLRKLLISMNDNNGSDLMFYENEMTYGRIPISYVSAMDSGVYAQYDPIFFLNFNEWKFLAVRGIFMRETEPQVPYDMPDTIVSAIVTHYAYGCRNRRAQAVINKTA